MRVRAFEHRGDAEEGQILPALLGFALAIVAVGVVLFQVGRAADLRGKAQTAADAAAIAAAENLRQQYAEAVHECDCPNQAGVFGALAQPDAEGYAAANGARLEEFEPLGLVVRVSVGTNADINRQQAAPIAGEANGHAGARAKVFVDPTLWPLVAAYAFAEEQIPTEVVLQFLHVRLVPDQED